MFTGIEDMQATALRNRGWSISAIARHLGRDRKTVRAHLNGERVAGVRLRSVPDPFDEFIPYLRARFKDDAHVWASALFDEVVELGFPLSYQSFTRGIRRHELRPHCEECDGVKGRATIEIFHPAGEEIQWDWLELPTAPWGGDGHLLVGSLPCSGKFRAAFADSEDQPHVIEGIDSILRRLGGTARKWRFDRMATVVDPKTGIVRPSFVPVARHYGIEVVVCPPRRGNRKGSVEKSNHFATQRFWRTMTARTMAEAQVQLDRFCERIADRRPRSLARLEAVLGAEGAAAFMAETGRRRPTIADIAIHERLAPIPVAAYPAMVEVTNTVGRSRLVAFEGNSYSVPDSVPIQGPVRVRHRLGTETVEIVTTAGVVVFTHRRREPGTGTIVRDPGHQAALEHEVLAAFTTAPPCQRKFNRPPSIDAQAEAAKLLSRFEDVDVVVSLATYQQIIDEADRNGEAAR
jgi:transposase